MFIAFAIPLPPSTLMDNYMQLSFLHSSPIVLVITRYPEILRIFRESFGSAALQLLFLMNTCMNNSSHLPGIRSSLVVQVFRKILRNAIRSSEILSSLLLLIFFTCLHNGYFHMSSNIH